MRVALCSTLLLATLLVASADGAEPQFELAFELTDVERIVVVDAAGTVVVGATAEAAERTVAEHAPTWSPDGSQLAYVREARPRGAYVPGHTREIYAANVPAGAPRRLTFDSGDALVFNEDPAWSPDGRFIAFVKLTRTRLQSGLFRLDDDIWLMNADGSAQRRLTTEGGSIAFLAWSPDATRLLYHRHASAPPYRAATFLIDLRTGARAAAPAGATAWSPDGAWLTASSTTGLDVVRPDGSERRRLAPPGVQHAWSPDGTRIAFARTRTFPEYGSRYATPAVSYVFSVRADSTDERRLTGLFAEPFTPSLSASAPVWWPDATRLFFERDGTYVMNADGTCEQRFAAGLARLTRPVWRPGARPTLDPLKCVDLRVTTALERNELPLRQPGSVQVRVENDGNEVATDVAMTIRTTHGQGDVTAIASWCRAGVPLECRLPPLAPRETVFEVARVGSHVAGTVRLHVEVAAAQRDSDPSTNAAETGVAVLPCDIVGTRSADRLTGTAGRDRICARPGADVIDGRGGDDRLEGDDGGDVISGGPGRDVVFGGLGSDTIRVRDGQRDVVDCGYGADTVVADRRDRAASDCERVLRP